MLAAVVAVATGGALGACARFATVTMVQWLSKSHFPFGTLFVNSAGSFLAGFLMIFIMDRVASDDFWRLFLVVGFLGAYTTFSSFSWETWMLFENGQSTAAFFNVLLNNVGALGLAFLGMICARSLGIS